MSGKRLRVNKTIKQDKNQTFTCTLDILWPLLLLAGGGLGLPVAFFKKPDNIPLEKTKLYHVSTHVSMQSASLCCGYSSTLLEAPVSKCQLHQEFLLVP